MLILRENWNKYLLRDIWVAWWGDTSCWHWVHVYFNIHLKKTRMNRLCGNPDKWFGLGRIFLFFLILSHTHHFLLNSPYTQALNHVTSFTTFQSNSILGMCFLGRSSGFGLIIETSISYHTTFKCNPDPTYESFKMPVSSTKPLSTTNVLYKEL